MRLQSRAAIAVLAVAVALFAAVAGARMASAQSVVIEKLLCDAAGCGPNNPPTGLPLVSPLTPLYYRFTFSSQPNANGHLVDALPAGFTVSSVVCGVSQSPVPFTVTNGTLDAGPLPTSPTTLECRVYGSFQAGSSGTLSNQGTLADGSTTIAQSSTSNTALALATPIPTNLAVVKTASVSSVNVTWAAQTITYTIQVTNAGPANVALGQVFALQDRLKLRPMSVPLTAQFLSATCNVNVAASNLSLPPSQQSNCVNPVPSMPLGNPLTVNSYGPMSFLEWKFPTTGPNAAGRLNAGDTIVVQYAVKVNRILVLDCILLPYQDGWINEAHIVLNLPGATSSQPSTALFDTNSADDTSTPNQLDVTTGATISDPACGSGIFPPSTILKIKKKQLTPTPPNGFLWNSIVKYRIDVTNITTNKWLRNIGFRDLVQEMPGTPPFYADLWSYYCPPSSIICQPVNASTAHTLGYGDTKQVMKATLDPSPGLALGPTQTGTFFIWIRYRNPNCDSYWPVGPKPIRNRAQIVGWTQTPGNTMVNTIVEDSVITYMRKPPICHFKTTKTLVTPSNGRVRFNGQINTFKLTFQNLDTLPHTLGTVIDTVRLTTQNYATQLSSTSRFKCGPSPGVSGYPPISTSWSTFGQSENIVYTQYVQQGVRLMQNINPVVFQPGATLTCFVDLKVQAPSTTDPFCAPNGVIENADIMDESLYYDPNLQWTALPGFYSTATETLPKCFDVLPNKAASPLWTWPGGTPITFSLSLSSGPQSLPMAGGTPLILDTIAPSSTTTAPLPFTCTPSGCAAAWMPGNPPSGAQRGTSAFRLLGWPTGASLGTTFTATPPSNAPLGSQMCNEAFGVMPPPLGPAPLDFYWKHPDPNNSSQTVHAKACAAVIATGTIQAHKIVIVDPGFVAPSYNFPVTLACTNPQYPVPNVPVTLAANGTVSIPGIPLNSTCTASEILPQPTAGTGGACRLQGWLPPTFNPNPLGPTTIGTTLLTVTNHYGCLMSVSGTIQLQKVVTANGTYTPPPSAAFPVTANCGSVTPTVTVPSNGTAQIANLAPGLTCGFTEQLPAPTSAPGCNNLGWFPPVFTPPTVTTNAGTVTVTVANQYGCVSPAGAALAVTKLVHSQPGFTPPPNAGFLTYAQCQAGAQYVNPLPNMLTAGATGLLTNIPAGATCTVYELPPPPMPMPSGCASVGWSAPLIAPNPVVASANATYPVTITNNFGCVAPNGPTGTVIVKKIVASGTFPAPAIPFTVTLQCQNGPAYALPISSSGMATFTNVTGGLTCTAGELPLPPPVPNAACPSLGWFPVQFSPNPVVVPSGGSVLITATNTYGCLP